MGELKTEAQRFNTSPLYTLFHVCVDFDKKNAWLGCDRLTTEFYEALIRKCAYELVTEADKERPSYEDDCKTVAEYRNALKEPK